MTTGDGGDDTVGGDDPVGDGGPAGEDRPAPGPDDLALTTGAWSSVREGARAVRERVFLEEQGVDRDLEYDGRDADARHVLALRDGRPVGTARVRSVDGDAKLERVAVLPGERGQGIGRALVRRAERLAATEAVPGEAAGGHDRVVCHAQVRVRAFYEELGYEDTGERFAEAGIPHLGMVKRLAGSGTGAGDSA